MSIQSISRALSTEGLTPLEKLTLIVLADSGDIRPLRPHSLVRACGAPMEDIEEALLGLHQKGLMILMTRPDQRTHYVIFPTDIDLGLADVWRNKRPGRPAIPPRVRNAVFSRDGYACTYCGTEEGPFHLDHVVPVSKGGENTEDNLVVACAACNLSKRDKTPEEWIGGEAGNV